MEITFKLLKEKDAGAAAALAAQIWREHYAPLIGNAQVEYMLQNFQSERAIKEAIAEGAEYYFIFRDKIVLGYFAVKEEETSLFLSKLYVKNEFRNNGIARGVIEFLKEEKGKRKKERIYLTVNKGNASSVAAYRALGFRLTKSVKTDIGNGFFMDDYIFEL